MDRGPAIERLKALISEMGEERKNRWGWQTEVASELGLDPAILGKLMKGERGVSVATLERIAAKTSRFRLGREVPLSGAGTASTGGEAALSASRATPEYVVYSGSAAEAAGDPNHWLADILKARGIVEPKRRAAVFREIDDAAGHSGITWPLVNKIVELWLAAEKGKRTDAGAQAAADEHGAELDAEMEAEDIKPLGS